MVSPACVLLGSFAVILAEPAISFRSIPGALVIAVDARPIATYYYESAELPRPYFAHVQAPGGVQVTRNHPPDPSIDDMDHAPPEQYYHPGFWLAFSDLSGKDYWRLKARVRHEGFSADPAGGLGQGTFTVRNAYLDGGDGVVARETCRYTILARPEVYFFVCDSLFCAEDRAVVFGDEEEMGFGLRVATPMAVRHGGRMIDSEGRVNEERIWSHLAAWCDYSGIVDGKRVGVLLAPDPENPLPSRFHARDYGFLAANPFGGKVFGLPEQRRTEVRPAETLALRFVAVTHGDRSDRELSALYDQVVMILKDVPRAQR